MGLYLIQNFCIAKKTINTVKREKIFAVYSSERENLNTKKYNKNGQMY
jgi:hypothetical protein